MEIYCSQLGMLIGFSYCVSMNDGLPCRNSIDCWKERLDIVAFLKAKYSDAELKKVFGSLPKTRLDRIMEMIREV
ncbi:MAG TPA: hypothetical protein PLX02_12655 [Syntrophorhabdaceae bacterium]|nr:hypothetical protein [Syntrophorhabdaceae bacterium]HQM82463.1 hypothetical protein [Syntrophorhabdaceae bacterium]